MKLKELLGKLDKNNKLLFILSLVFLVLIILHIFLYFQNFPYFTLKETTIGNCLVKEDNIILGYDSECIFLDDLNDKLFTYTSLLNRSSKKSNFYAIIGYLVAFLVTIIPLIKFQIKKKEN